MSVLLVAGSPFERSRSAALLNSVSQRLALHGATVERLRIRDLSPQALLLGDAAHRTIAAAIDKVLRSRVIVVATPVCKAAYSGVLKVFLDVLPPTALKNKTVLPLAAGGSAGHMPALDHALRPVLQALAARYVLPGVYATDSQVTLTPEGAYRIDADVAARLDEAVATLFSEGLRMPATAGFALVPFSQVRCSV